MKRLAALLTAFLASGCALSTPGELGKLEFRILADDATAGSSEIVALAPDTEVVIRVTRPGGRAALLTDFRVDEPWVVSVTRESPDAVRVKARTVGNTKLSVRAGGDDDRVMLNVLVPVAARVWGPASTGRERPLALRGEQARFPLTLTAAGGRRVLALGVPPPIRVVPEGAATLVPPKAREGTMINVTFERAGLVRFEGDLEQPLEVRVVGEEELESLELDVAKTQPANAAPSALVLRLRGVAAGARGDVVSSGARVSIDTPETCAEAPPQTTTERPLWGNGVVLIGSLGAGRCSGTVTFAGKSATFSQDVAPAPSPQR